MQRKLNASMTDDEGWTTGLRLPSSILQSLDQISRRYKVLPRKTLAPSRWLITWRIGRLRDLLKCLANLPIAVLGRQVAQRKVAN